MTHHERRSELAKLVPALTTRVFALQGKHYSGCGFHWAMMKSTGTLLNRLYDFDARFTEEDLLNCQVIYCDLKERVEMAERLIPK